MAARLRVRATASGTAFHVDGSFGSADVTTPMIGNFNVSNLLAVLGAALAQGVAWDAALAALRTLTPVDGRMELFGGQDAPLAVVDYAHTPDALAQTLAALRPVAEARSGPALVRVRLRRRPRRHQAPADGRRGRASGRRHHPDQ